MLIWCGLSADELRAAHPDLAVLPENVPRGEILKVARRLPDAIVVGAQRDGPNMRGVIRHRGRNRIRYLKVGSDHRTSEGVGLLPASTPVYVSETAAIGLLICMDLNCTELMLRVVEGLQRAPPALKVLCVPGEMHANSWSFGDVLTDLRWTGLHIVLCNGVRSYPDARVRSFITDTQRRKAREQVDREPISLRV